MDEGSSTFSYGEWDTAGGGTYEFDPKRDSKRKFVTDVKEQLENIQGLGLEKSSEANQAGNLRGSEHLNPKMVAAVIYFRHNTKEIEEMKKSTLSKQMSHALDVVFGKIDKKSKKYMLLKGDMIRYITLFERENEDNL